MRITRPKLVLDWEPATFAPVEHRHLSNADMDPVPVQLRTWKWYNYVAFWFSDAFTVGGFQQAGAFITLGLSPQQAIIVIIVGHIFMAFPISAMGWIGAKNHVPFPVLSRMTFGFWFSYVPVLIRALMACIYFGTQSYNGALATSACISAIWPSFKHFPNHLPLSANITSANLLCYVLFWLTQFPFMLLSPSQLRWLFGIKCITGPITGFGLMIWGLKNGANKIFDQPSKLHGSNLSWAMLIGINSILGSNSTYAINMNDFTRYAQNPRQQWVILFAIPIMYSVIGVQGVICAAASQQVYKVLQWNPVVLVNYWDNRPGKFFAGASLAFTCIGTNISGNSLAAGNDLTAMAPKYINLRRGQILCAFIGGWVCCPWQVLATSSTFLAFLSGYGSLLTPIYAMLICSYFVVHRCKIDIPAMYRPHARYHYWHGINWRAVVSLLTPWAIAMPGLAAAIKPKLPVPRALINYYNLGWLTNFWIAFILYAGLSAMFPARESYVDHNIDSLEDESDSEKKQAGEDEEKDMAPAAEVSVVPVGDI